MLPSEIIKKNLVILKTIKKAIQGLPEDKRTPVVSDWLKELSPAVRRSEGFLKENKGKRSKNAAFEAWYDIYPLKANPKKALEQWEVTGIDNDLLQEIMLSTKAVAKRRSMEISADKNVTPLPHPAQWLKDSRWLDDLTKYKRFIKTSKPEMKTRDCYVCKASLDLFVTLKVEDKLSVPVCHTCHDKHNGITYKEFLKLRL